MSQGRRVAVVPVSFGALAAVTAVLVGWFGGNGTFAHWLFSIAGSLECWGVVLVAWPELAPYAHRLRTALKGTWERARGIARRGTDRLRRIFNRPARRHVVSADAAISSESALAGRGVVGPPKGATTEEKVEFLLRRDQATQERLAELGDGLNALPEDWQKDIEAAAAKLREEQEAGLASLRDEHLTQRLWGVAFLIAGLFLATWGNLAAGSQAAGG